MTSQTNPEQPPLPWYVRKAAWPTGVLLLIVSAVLIGWLIKPVTTGEAAPAQPAVADEQALSDLLTMQTAQNALLKRAITQAEQDMSAMQCQAPSPQNDTSRPSHVPAELPAPVEITGAPLKPRALQSLAAQAVVFVAAKAKGSQSAYNTGTGFFISPTHILTNAHVVDGIQPDTLRVFSDVAQQSAPAQIVQVDYQRAFGGRDYAILSTHGLQAPGTLAINSDVSQLMGVISAGYPGVYRDIISGLVDLNQNRLPPYIVTDGIVSSINESRFRVPTLSHTAEIHGGNSGGPLINRCGAVVGINTFIATPGEPPAKINFALGGQDIVAYLSQHGIAYDAVRGGCE